MDPRQEESVLSCVEESRKTCRRVITNKSRRLQEVTRRNGGHMDHTLTQKNYTHREHGIHFL